MNKEAPENDNRDYFRVNKDVVFDFRPVEASQVSSGQPAEAFENSVHLSLLHRLKQIDKESSKSLQLLTEKNRLLADYLKSLSQKIDLVAQHILFSEDTLHTKAKPNANNESGNLPITKQEKPEAKHANIEKNRARINLSEDGIAFVSQRALYKDSFIAMQLIFLPSYTVVSSFAKILRCAGKGKHYQAAAQFYQLGAIERQEISREILKAQVQYK